MRKEVKRYLWKLGELKDQRIERPVPEGEPLPENVLEVEGIYYLLDDKGMSDQEVELLLRAKTAHILNVIKVCAIVGAASLAVMALIPFLILIRW